MANKKIKSEKSQLVELISKQLGITKKSASARISRVASGKSDPKKATAKLTKYAKTKFNKEVKKTKAVRAEKEFRKNEKEILAELEKQVKEKWRNRVNYGASERHTVTVEAEFDFYGSDKRKRAIRFDLFGDEINEFMNAPNAQAAVNTLKNSNAGQFLEDAAIRDFENFTIHGKTYDENYFD